jgi:hypothetical protein
MAAHVELLRKPAVCRFEPCRTALRLHGSGLPPWMHCARWRDYHRSGTDELNRASSGRAVAAPCQASSPTFRLPSRGFPDRGSYLVLVGLRTPAAFRGAAAWKEPRLRSSSQRPRSLGRLRAAVACPDPAGLCLQRAGCTPTPAAAPRTLHAEVTPARVRLVPCSGAGPIRLIAVLRLGHRFPNENSSGVLPLAGL